MYILSESGSQFNNRVYKKCESICKKGCKTKKKRFQPTSCLPARSQGREAIKSLNNKINTKKLLSKKLNDQKCFSFFD